MELYRNTDLANFESQAPFSTHPYQHWKENLPEVGATLEKMADELHLTNGFYKRLKKARADVINPLDFFPFITELKVVHFLQKNNYSPEFITSNSASPDVKLCNGIFVEVHTESGKFFTLTRAKEELDQIAARTGRKFYFTRRYGLPPYREDEIPFKWSVLFPALSEEILKLKDKPLEKNPFIIWGERDSHHLFGELSDYEDEDEDSDKISSDPDLNNASAVPAESIKLYINNCISNKIKEDGITLHNGLAKHRPNVLWLEMLYSQEEFARNRNKWSSFDFTKIAMPAELDSIIVSICGIDKGYDESEKPMLRLNEKISTDPSAKITQWFNSLKWKN
jgi:hypothetical protein